MQTEAFVVKELEYPDRMSWDLVDRFADGIPSYDNDPSNPEWRATPVIPVDLRDDGYGIVHVKNESDKRSNPTQTIKDRAAWEIATIYRDFGRGLYLKRKSGSLNGDIARIPVPRLSLITAGNVGRAISHVFNKYGLPPMKLLLDRSLSAERLEILKQLHADLYMVDLDERLLLPQDIKRLTNNENGIDITSVMAIEPQAVFYDWHVHESFNENPDEIYLPYGSGRLFENYLTWQERSLRNHLQDSRLRTDVGRVIGMSILGGEPVERDSLADKLTKSFNPFVLFDDQDIAALNSFSFTGRNTGIYKVKEEKIREAYQLLSRHMETEHSSSAGLALYLQRFSEGKVDSKNKVLVINTGKGI